MYECHITIDTANGLIKTKNAVQQHGWKFSAIDGDPVLGHGIKYYATAHYSNRRKENEIIEIMNQTAELLKNEGFNILRQKVELIIYDTKRVEQ